MGYFRGSFFVGRWFLFSLKYSMRKSVVSIVLVENKRVDKLIWGVGVLTVGLFWILKLVFFLRLLLYLGYYSINGWDFLVVITKLGKIIKITLFSIR